MNNKFYIQSRPSKSPTYSQCLALESRMVFDGAIAATVVDVQSTVSDYSAADSLSVATTVPDIPPATDFAPEKAPQTVDFAPTPVSDNNQLNVPVPENPLNPIDTVAADTNPQHATTLTVIDPRADNATLLTSNPPANTQIFVLDINRDGFQQIAEQLQSRQDVAQLDIIPWTKNSQQWLGSKPLSATLETSVTSSLMAWNDGLANDAKLIFHGQNDLGAGWDNYVSSLTGAQTKWTDVTDLTPAVNSLPTPSTVYFIDSAVKNSVDIVSGLDANAEIVYLNANTDGLTQIADYLAGRSGIDNIQIISHGSDATLQLGNEILTNENLASHAEQLATIGHALTANGDILFYGCDLAKSTDGSKFVDTFAYLTQADVAASTDLTGAASKGGNWTLEYSAGTIEASILAASHYQDVLAMQKFNVAGLPLVFNAPQLVGKGNGLTKGDVVVFRNVVTVGAQAIDAVVTFVDNTPGITVTNFDTANGPIGANSRNDSWFELITNLTTPNTVNAALTIKFQFILGGSYDNILGTGTDVLLQNLVVNSYDVDSNQYQEFTGFSSYTLASDDPGTVANEAAQLAVSTQGNFTRFTDSSLTGNDAATPAPGTAANDPNLILFNRARVVVNYNEINTFQIQTGSSKPGDAYYYLDFSNGFNLTNPSTIYTVPDAVDDFKVGVPGNPVVIDVLFNDNKDPTKPSTNPIDPRTVSIIGSNTPGGPYTAPGEGTWSVNPLTGAITFTPQPGFLGDPTPIQYTVKDTNGILSDIATVTIDYPPVAVDDTVPGIPGVPTIVKVVNNDSDPDNNLDPKTVKIVGTTNPGDPLVILGQGTWTVNPNTGDITFTPIPGFTGIPAPIQYTVKDTSNLESNPATVTITLNKLPVANPDTNNASVGGAPVTGDVISNESTLGDIPTQVTSASQGAKPITIGVPFSTAGGGILILNADGSYIYTPPKNVSAIGLTELFNYTITDINGDISSSILTINLGPTGDSGSSILLSNPSLSFSDDRSIFFAPNPLATVTLTDPRVYIPIPDGILSLTGSLRNQVVLELKHFSFDIPSGAFRHTNPNAQLEFEATRPDGTALPEWLIFNPKLLRFSGTPPRGAHNQEVMVTARDSFGNEVEAIFYVYVNKERVRTGYKSLSIDPKLLGLSKKVLEKHHKEKPVVSHSKSGLSERIQSEGKSARLQESRAILDSLKSN